MDDIQLLGSAAIIGTILTAIIFRLMFEVGRGHKEAEKQTKLLEQILKKIDNK